MTTHDLKLVVINSPGECAKSIAMTNNVALHQVYYCFETLNISRRNKPKHCKG